MADLAGDDAHILVVDDDDRIRTLLKRFLQERGYRVSTAPNADKALSTLNSLAFDLLVLDVMKTHVVPYPAWLCACACVGFRTGTRRV